MRDTSAVLVLLQRLNVWGASRSATPSKILHILFNILHILSNILHTLSNILHNRSNILHTLSNILRTPSNIYISHLIFFIPPQIFFVTHLIFYKPPPISYVNLTVDSTVRVLACPCPVQLVAFQGSAHSRAPVPVW